MVDDAIAFLDAVVGGPDDLVGHSEAAFVAMQVAIQRSDLVTMQHVVDMYAALPGAELAVVPGTSHFLTQEKPDLVNRIVLDFLTTEPVATVAPIPRAPQT